MQKNIRIPEIKAETDFLREPLNDLFFFDGEDKQDETPILRTLSLFSGCGGMDLGFEGGFLCHKKAVEHSWVERSINKNWVLLKRNRFRTVFACDILKEAQNTWLNYMKRYNVDSSIYHLNSIVDLVKLHKNGHNIFPKNVDIITGGFPCQDFSVSGKRKGFASLVTHMGNRNTFNIPNEETRGNLYMWMKYVIDIVKPKMFVAENVKGLISLGDVKNIIQQDFSSANGGDYIVLPPQILHAAHFGVPEKRERIIFIGIKRSALSPKALDALSQETIPSEYNPYPTATHYIDRYRKGLKSFVTCKDVLEHLPEPSKSDDLSQQNYSKAKFQSNGTQGQTEINYNGLAPTIRSEHHGNIEFRRLSLKNGGKNTSELALGLEERRLTPRECALLQSFPPDYPFVSRKPSSSKYIVSPSSAYKVIGNAVPPMLAYNLARRIQALWDTYFKV